MHVPPAPLFRDPVYDGAADPVVVYDRAKKLWTMFYTQRRAALELADVAYCYGTAIGMATSDDHGKTWVYKGALKLEFEDGKNTFWAPEIVFDKGIYHMYVAYIPGVRNHWGGKAQLIRYTSKDLWNWKFEGYVKLNSDNAIDATLMKMPDQQWHVWYKDQSENGKSRTMTASSSDLVNWKNDAEPAIGGDAHEGPKIFRYKKHYWMITDVWKGQQLYRSSDGKTWVKQGMLLDKPGTRKEDTPTGAHADVVITAEDKAYIIYFTHPGRETHFEGELNADGVLPYTKRRSSIQAAELIFENGTLSCDRDKPFEFNLTTPKY
ncbi:MAG: family 43 glycosylhydrolase [Mucilaginibacter polytrichastri]|nr:family 43 glycosylhydrolase [Mucilaginibacter polytrichastri]